MAYLNGNEVVTDLEDAKGRLMYQEVHSIDWSDSMSEADGENGWVVIRFSNGLVLYADNPRVYVRNSGRSRTSRPSTARRQRSVVTPEPPSNP